MRGNVIMDDKTTGHFDAGDFEKYIDKFQWRYYLDIFGAQEFIWKIWETKEIDMAKHGGSGDYPGVTAAWEVFNCHTIRNYRYPELERECRELAIDYKEFAERVGVYA